MTFDEAIPDLNTVLQKAGRQLLTKEAADLAIAAASPESVSPALMAFTHLCENGFGIYVLPNVNHQPASPWHFDVGPLALNLGWAMRSIFKGDYTSKGLTFEGVFGKSFYEADGVTPCKFNGDPVQNARLAARRLLSFHGDPAVLGYTGPAEMKAVRFTGPAHQPKRLELFRLLMPAFSTFFEQYQG